MRRAYIFIVTRVDHVVVVVVHEVVDVVHILSVIILVIVIVRCHGDGRGVGDPFGKAWML